MKNDIRSKLFSATSVIATQIPHDDLSISRVCEVAGIPASDFKTTFGDIPTYLEAVQQDFLQNVRARIINVTNGATPGLLRIKLGSESYLAYCAENAGVRDWLVAARAQPRVLRGLQQQNQSFTLVLGAELRALGRYQPDAAARLYIAMLNEVASSEQRSRRRLPDLRDALWHFLDHVGTSLQQRNAA
ncbi:hypothetical protein [Solimonas terrae]|uniref:TetR/AcrR family transcriptional regulator n=1 Tax=Solimonas terrae TaxID=1396819 RepID=A0A6M2BVS7_9GAMM|nr:hypothetical protein [Solimonas terrae]NGY06666.1 hypothetical protein [Solimonas terrae]